MDLNLDLDNSIGARLMLAVGSTIMECIVRDNFAVIPNRKVPLIQQSARFKKKKKSNIFILESILKSISVLASGGLLD